MNKYTELTLLTLKKWDLIRYIFELYNIIDTALEYNQDMREHLSKEFWFGRLEAQEEILKGERNDVNNYFDKERRNSRICEKN